MTPSRRGARAQSQHRLLLGYLRELPPRRPDLKVIVTSADHRAGTVRHPLRRCPVVEVSGLLYPVEIRYRPLESIGAITVPVPGDPDDPDHEVVRVEPRDQTEAIIDALRELSAEPPGDVLVFPVR